ncbi:MAG: type II secretion system protein GspD [Pseudomonadales bacterium]
MRQRIIALTLSLLVGCASTPTGSDLTSAPSTSGELNTAIIDLRTGRPADARAALAPALRSDPRNGYLHLLNGMSYELEDRSPQSLDLAAVGYSAATRFAPGFYWGHYHEGALALERQAFTAAAEQFSQAILADPGRPEAFLGLAAAAYYAGDLDVAARAAEAAGRMASGDPLTLRTSAFIAAATGDRPALGRVTALAGEVPGASRLLEEQRGRLDQLLRLAALSTDDQPAAPPRTPASDRPADSQVMVEVTLLLSQSARARRTGINLLDGLSLQFSGALEVERFDPSPGSVTKEAVTTAALSIPQVSYSLNLFNTRDDFYQVLARPSLVATVGETSEFFIGRTVTVGVSGVNLGTLEPVDVGTSVTVTPLEITATSTRFRVSAGRSFFAQDTGGTFEQSLTTFKQTVDATVEVEFGKTLILSGLYEGVNVGGSSKVPGLGDVPVVDTVFNARNRTTRQDAALMLVTPRRAGTIETASATFRGETLTRLLAFWNDFVEPTSDLDAILKTIGSKTKYFRPLAGDLRIPDSTDPRVLVPTLDDVAARLR